MHLRNPITPRTGRQRNKKQQPECGQLNLSLIRDQYDILQSALRRQGSGFYTYCPCIPRRIRSVAFLSFYSLVSFFFYVSPIDGVPLADLIFLPAILLEYTSTILPWRRRLLPVHDHDPDGTMSPVLRL